MAPDSLLACLDDAARTDRGITLLAESGPVRMRYAEVARLAARVAGGLKGIQDPGQPLLFVYPTGTEFIETFFGAMWAGLVPAPLPMPRPFSDLEEYARRLAHCSDRTGGAPVVTSPLIASFLKETRAGCSLRLLDIASLRAGAPVDSVSVGPTAMLQFTSGSLSDPKGTMLSHRALLADVNGTADRIDGRNDDDVVTGWVPLVHDMGLIGGLIYPIVCGISTVLIPTDRFIAEPQIWLRAMHEFRTTLTGAPPFGYGFALRRTPPARYDLSALRCAIVGAEPIDVRILRSFISKLAPSGLRANVFRPTYGMAECCVVATTTAPDTPITTVDAGPKLEPGGIISLSEQGTGLTLVGCGSAIPGLEVQVAGEDGTPLPELAIGQIRLRGAACFDGYWGDKEATEAARDGQWLLSGDLGFYHAGALYIAGRQKDVIIQRGRHIFPEEIEAIAVDLPGVRPRGALAFGKMDPAGGHERIHLVLETSETEEKQMLIADLARKLIADRLDCNIDAVSFCGPRELPRTPSGKIRRGEGRARWGEA